jgi:hypothetical protein
MAQGVAVKADTLLAKRSFLQAGTKTRCCCDYRFNAQ